MGGSVKCEEDQHVETDTVEGNGLPEDGLIRLDRYGSSALVTKQALTRLLGCHESTIEAAVTRGDLPPPVALMGRKVWMVGVICDHLRKRLDDAAREAEKETARLRRV